MSFEVKPKSTEAAVDMAQIPEEERREIEAMTPAAQAEATNSDTTDWDTPRFIMCKNEKLVGKGNAWIRFGKDRNSHVLSGEGGAGTSHAAAIDVVAGYAGWLARKQNKAGKNVAVNPNFKVDAARIYLSQKSDVDGYFELPEGTVGSTTSGAPGKDAILRSCVALKADTIRLIARENIKLVTRTDQLNSQGGKLDNKVKYGYGIDLIAMNDDTDMQPLVKGENLVECLGFVIELLENLTLILGNFFEYDSAFKDKVAVHTHTSPFYGSETAPDYKQILMEGVQQSINAALNCQVPLHLDWPLDLVALKNDFLNADGGPTADKYILSKYNSTN